MHRLLAGRSGFDVEPLMRAGMVLELDRPAERIACESPRSAVIERLCLIQTPEAHGTLGVDSHTLFEGASRFIVPVIMEQIQPLVKPDLSFRGRRNF